jgi:hypothetical protein
MFLNQKDVIRGSHQVSALPELAKPGIQIFMKKFSGWSRV